MRKKSIKAAKKRTPPAMPTPSPILRPVLEDFDDDWVVPLSRGEPEFEDVGEVGPVLVGPLDAAAVGLVLLVDDEEEEVEVVDVVVVDVVVVDVVAVDATYSTPVGTEAEKSADVVGV
jgi:hypothetical protein